MGNGHRRYSITWQCPAYVRVSMEMSNSIFNERIVPNECKYTMLFGN